MACAFVKNFFWFALLCMTSLVVPVCQSWYTVFCALMPQSLLSGYTVNSCNGQL